MTDDYTSEPLWINEPDWLCAVEFFERRRPRRVETLPRIRSVIYSAIHISRIPDRLHSLVIHRRWFTKSCFHFPLRLRRKDSWISIRSNNDLGSEYIDNDLIQPVKDEVRIAQPLAKVLPP